MTNPYVRKFSRYAMYKRIREKLHSLKLKPGKCLLVGDTLEGSKGNPTLVNMLPKSTKIVAPDFPEVDIHDMPYRYNEFDYVMSDQVLEHVQKPWIAMEEVRRVLKPGGIAVMTSCLFNDIHGVPYDFWRFTPNGLKILCEKFSKIHQADGMGDRELVITCLKGKRGHQVKPGSPLEKKAMAYDGKFMLHVWVIAEK